MERRRFLRLACGGLVAVSAACAAGPAWALLLEPSWLILERVRVRPKNLAPSLRGLRIAFLSDLHRGPHVDPSHIRRAVRMAREAAPHLVLLGGDFVSQSAAYADSCAQELASLQAPLGVYACLGNHDYWTNPDVITEALSRVGIRVFRNAGWEVADRLWVAAVDDVWEGRPSLETALRGMPTDAQAILLAHEPDYADVVAADRRVMLMLSGHTHGGQVRLPLLGPPVLPYLGQRYPAGLYTLGEMTLYVSRGVGLIAPPVRFNCRPEVTLLILG
ncbi:MAG: metallophosphoesterase [Anaerolineae bacterium]